VKSTANSAPGAASAEVAKLMRREREAVADAFASALQAVPRWKVRIDAERSRWNGFLATEFFAFVDYLAERFRTGDIMYRQLLVGEKIKALYDPDTDDAERQRQTETVHATERRAFESLLKPRLSPDAWALLTAEINAVHGAFVSQAQKAQRVLLIGDCIFLDIVPFVVGELLQASVRLIPEYATSKNPIELRDQLRKMSARKFDLVFISPFSYEFAPAYSQLALPRGAVTGARQIAAVAEQAWADARGTINLAANLFDCPIIVHNSAAVVREEGPVKRAVKSTLTGRARALGRLHVNAMLEAHVREANAASFKHLFLFDECRHVRSHGEWRSGAFYYRTALQHPAVLGSVLAPHYVDLTLANATLVKKKLIVSDLDNTLWDGVIGEGDVAHYHSRQQVLKNLKEKGVVLAIASKNDPAKVHWRGGTLSDKDFVHAEISWAPKVQAMKRIQSELNLKMKDFVFIDDRPDELELMRSTYPEVVCLDATNPATWRRLQVWSDLLDDDVEMDRTLMYQQREKRKEFTVDDASDADDRAKLFAALGLKVTLTRARPSDLKRVTELINRTNQFNLDGRRTSFREVTGWHAASDHIVLTAQTADRFGDMGTTCIAVARLGKDEMRLLAFVLSCRVFGYGVERSVLNQLKKMAEAGGVGRLVGNYVRTAQNSPCEDFLPGNGFAHDGKRWIFVVGSNSPPNEAWLTVDSSAV
jgi:FkbH-like protein